MKRIILQSIALSLLLVNSHAQSPILSNPSRCGDVGVINDNTCPGNDAFFEPNRYIIKVMESPGSRLGGDVYLKEVRLIITHTWTADLDIFLISPSGKRAMLTSDNGGGEDNYGQLSSDCSRYTTFAAVSCLPVQLGRPPFLDGPYLPEESLSTFDDGSSPLGDWTLQICDDSEQDSGRLHFVELVFDRIQCLPVQRIDVVGQDTTSVVLDWSPSEGCQAIRTLLEYGPKGFKPGSDALPGLLGRVLEIKCPPYRLEGLPPDTEFDFYIRKSCGPGSYSGSSCPVTVRTGCLPPGPQRLENFSDASVCTPVCGLACNLSGMWQNASGDDFDWLAYQGATPTQGTGPSDGAVPGGKYVYIEASGSQCTGRAILRSGCILLDKKGSDACHLSFSYHMFGTNIGALTLEATADGIRWIPLWQRQGDQGNQWGKAYIALNSFPDSSLLQFRFIATKGNGPLGDIALAEIAFHGSTYLGMPVNRYYADRDGDGYGDPHTFVEYCSAQPPAGYIERAGDCDDLSVASNPGAPEIPCDETDNNCNGASDDVLLSPPLATGDTVCSGEKASVQAIPVMGTVVVWYDVPQGGQPLAFSFDYIPPLPPNTGSSPQVYRFYAEAMDDGFRCFSTSRAEAVVVVNPLPVGQLATLPAFCRGDSLELGTVDIADGHLTGAGLSFHSGLPATPFNRLSRTKIMPFDGQYIAYQLTSPGGCTFSGSFSLKERPLPTISFLPTDSFALCIGSFRTVEAIAKGGAGGYKYLWESGDILAYTGISGGTVAGVRRTIGVRVTDAAGCGVADSIVFITTSSMDSLLREVVDASACGARDGKIILRPLDGVPPFSYRWASGNGVGGEIAGVTTVPFSLNNLAQGSYRITVTDSSNEKCAFILPPTYVNGTGAQVKGIRVGAPRCTGAADGSICLEIPGNSTATFRWSSGDTTACTRGIRSGLYAVTISESSCTTVLDSIFVPDPPALSANAIVRPASCSDGKDGAISVTAYGGSGGYRFRWGNGFLTSGIANLAPGQYAVTITDLDGCSLVRQYQVTAPSELKVLADSLADVACFGGADGVVQVSGRGGTAPYQYLWENGATAPLRNKLGNGTYRVSVIDFNGCAAQGVFTVGAPSILTASVAILALPRCNGDSSGVLEAKGMGGSIPYTYLWGNGETRQTLTNAGVGEYDLQIRDRKGCLSDTATIQLSAPESLQWNATVAMPLCKGRADGRIGLNPTGRGPFRYLWNGGDTSAVIIGRAEGKYSVSVWDISGCRYDTAFELRAQEMPIQLDIVAIPPSCTGGNDGLLRLEPLQVRYPPLFYKWENGFSGRERSGLGEGGYQVTITDGQGCQSIPDTIRLKNPPPLSYVLMSKGEIACRGDSTGFLEIEVKGGVPPYNFRWIGTSSTASSAFGLGAGAYRFFATDSKGCPLNAVFSLQEPPAIRLAAEVRIGNICEGDTSNQLKAVVSGGIPPFSLRWNNGRTEPVLNNVPPGDYTFSVQDSNGCRQVLPPVKVRDNGKPLELLSFQVRDISCFGEVDGSLSVSVKGGKPPYTYAFKGTATTVQTFQSQWNLSGLGSRSSYGVVVSDALGCRVESAERPLREPPLLNIRKDSIQLVNCAGPNSGAVYVTAMGGTPPYAFNWFDEASGREVATTEDLISFKSGNYRLVVTDSRVCSDTLFAINIPTRSSLRLESAAITGVSCRGDTTGRIEARLSGGRSPYTYFWNGVAGGATLRSARGGIYELTVVDADSCRTTFPLFEIPEPTLAIGVQPEITPVQCPGGSNGEIRVRISGTQGVFQTIWRDPSGGQVALDTLWIGNLFAGRYRLLVRDEKGCSAVFDYDVNEPGPLQFKWTSSFSNEPVNAGNITVEVSGGTPPYRFLWNSGDTTASLAGLTPGVYGLTVTDFNGCSAQDSIRLLSTRLNPPTFPVASGKIFPNPTGGILTLELDFPVTPRSLQWRITDLNGRPVAKGQLPGQQLIRQEIPLEGLPSSWYVLLVYDASGWIWRERLLKL